MQVYIDDNSKWIIIKKYIVYVNKVGDGNLCNSSNTLNELPFSYFRMIYTFYIDKKKVLLLSFLFCMI